jgi:hypothetical protein
VAFPSEIRKLVTAPRGPNHAKKLFDYASRAEDWFAEKLTADVTGVFSREQLDRIRDDLKGLHGPNDGEAIFNQEYFCSFESMVIGSYYGAIIEQLERDDRITEVPYDSNVSVTTAWDLGIGDSTAIWFLQEVAARFIVLTITKPAAWTSAITCVS